MTDKGKNPEQVTDAGAVEIEEADLDQASGAAGYDAYLKLDGVPGESKGRPDRAGWDLKAGKAG